MIRAVVVLLILAAVLYGIFWVIDRRNSSGGSAPPNRPVPRGPMGPDDDENFLRDLDRRQHKGDNDRPDLPGEP